MMKPQITYEDFEKVDIRVGKVVKVEDLLGKQVVCVVNFALRQIGPFVSEVLTLGPDDGTSNESSWVALTSLKEVPLGRGVR